MTSMTPCLANSTPDDPEPLPNTKAPPWIHTMTGNFASGPAVAGRHTLMKRQSSDEFGAMLPAPPRANPAWAQFEPNLLASRSPSHEGGGWGGRQRLEPTGAAA